MMKNNKKVLGVFYGSFETYTREVGGSHNIFNHLKEGLLKIFWETLLYTDHSKEILF